MERYDLLVVGAGVSGLSSAYHVIQDNPDMKICVVDRSPTYAQGNTAKSAAAFRDIFSSDTNYKLASSSISFYKHVQQDLGFDLGMHFNGYLFLLDDEKINSAVIKDLSSKVRSRIIGREKIEELGIKTQPNKEASAVMNLKNIAGGFIGENCGIMEPDLIASFYVTELKKKGIDFKFSTDIDSLNLQSLNKLDYPGEPFIWQVKKVDGARSGDSEIKADNLLLATDVWTSKLTNPLGIDTIIQPKKVQVFQVSGNGIQQLMSRGYDNTGLFPFTVLPSPSIIIRPDPKSKSMWISYDEGIGRGFGLEDDPVVEQDFYVNNLYPVISEYIPSFIDSRVTSSWAGFYSVNSIDGSYVLLKEMNLSIITGSSGSGIMKADSAGRVASALVTGQDFARLYDGSEIKVSDLGLENRRIKRESLII